MQAALALSTILRRARYEKDALGGGFNRRPSDCPWLLAALPNRAATHGGGARYPAAPARGPQTGFGRSLAPAPPLFAYSLAQRKPPRPVMAGAVAFRIMGGRPQASPGYPSPAADSPGAGWALPGAGAAAAAFPVGVGLSCQEVFISRRACRAVRSNWQGTMDM